MSSIVYLICRKIPYEVSKKEGSSGKKITMKVDKEVNLKFVDLSHSDDELGENFPK